MPLWVLFPNLPLECWNAKVLSQLASRIGSPIITDKLTRTLERISFARVLIDVDISKPLVRTINVVDSRGIPFVQDVHYEVEPSFCATCHSVGHATGSCKSSKSKGVSVEPATVPSADPSAARTQPAPPATSAQPAPPATSVQTDPPTAPAQTVIAVPSSAPPAATEAPTAPSPASPEVPLAPVPQPTIPAAPSSIPPSTSAVASSAPTAHGQPDPDGYVTVIPRRRVAKVSSSSHQNPIVGNPVQLKARIYSKTEPPGSKARRGLPSTSS